MKKQLRLWGMIPLVLLVLAACSKDDTSTKDQGTGNVKITFGFEKATETKAGTGVKKPVTSWTKSVQDLIILFVKDGVVKDARNITPPTGEDLAVKDVSLKNIPAMTDCNIYVIANSGVSANINRRGWRVENAVGRNLTDLYLDMVTDNLPTEMTGTGYKEPAEIFIATQTATIEADKTKTIESPFALTRVVSLVRVRLKPTGDNATKIDFTTAGKAAIFLRRTELALNFQNTFSGKADDKGVIINTSFSDAEPTTGYNGDQLILSGDIKYFKDFLCLPGGGVLADPSANKFDLVIKGSTSTTDYIPAGQTDPVAKDTPVFWSGPVNEKIGPNGILDITVTINSFGEQDEPTPGSTYGNLEIKVNLQEWGAVTSTTMEM